MRYYAQDPYSVLQESGLPYVATERFALDQLLGRDVKKIDRYIVYIRPEDEEKWKEYLSDRAVPRDLLPNLLLHPTENEDILGDSHLVPLEVLARDLGRMAPRYFTLRHREIWQKAPQLYAKILQFYPPDSLNLPDTAPKAS